LLPYFQGERTPNLPAGTGVCFGLDSKTFDRGHLARAAMEGATFGLRYGLDVLRRCGIEPHQIRLTGGGARSPVWRQIVADIFGCEVMTLPRKESAAFGAAIQALWARESLSGRTDIADLTERYVEGTTGATLSPDRERTLRYSVLYDLYLDVGRSLEALFERRRRLLGA
jgi:sugar (pentulose or hexulose) kinase